MSITMTDLATRAKATLGTVGGSQAAVLKSAYEIQMASYMLIQQEEIRLAAVLSPTHPRVLELKDRQLQLAQSIRELLARSETEMTVVSPLNQAQSVLVQGRVFDSLQRGVCFLDLSFQDDAFNELAILGSAITDAAGYFGLSVLASAVTPLVTTNIYLVLKNPNNDLVARVPVPKEQFVAGATVSREFMLDRDILNNGAQSPFVVGVWDIQGTVSENGGQPTAQWKIKAFLDSDDSLLVETVSNTTTDPDEFAMAYLPTSSSTKPPDSADVYFNVYEMDDTLLYSGKTESPPVFYAYSPGSTTTVDIDVLTA